MCVELVRATEFIKTRREREEKLPTVLIVGGVKVVVFIYDFCTDKNHEVFVCVDKDKEECVVKIPKMYIKQEADVYSIVRDIVTLAL